MWMLLVLTLVMVSLAAAFLIAFHAGPTVWQVPVPIPGLKRVLQISGFGISLTILASAFLIGILTLEGVSTDDIHHRRPAAGRADP